jgi:hypothetical protein
MRTRWHMNRAGACLGEGRGPIGCATLWRQGALQRRGGRQVFVDGKPHRTICVFRVHRLSLSALKPCLLLQCHKVRNAGRDRRRSQPLRATAGTCSIGQDHCAGAPVHRLRGMTLIGRIPPPERLIFGPRAYVWFRGSAVLFEYPFRVRGVQGASSGGSGSFPTTWGPHTICPKSYSKPKSGESQCVTKPASRSLIRLLAANPRNSLAQTALDFAPKGLAET